MENDIFWSGNRIRIWHTPTKNSQEYPSPVFIHFVFPRPPSHQNQKWENNAFCPLRGFIRDLGGKGVCCSIISSLFSAWIDAWMFIGSYRSIGHMEFQTGIFVERKYNGIHPADVEDFYCNSAFSLSYIIAMSKYRFLWVSCNLFVNLRVLRAFDVSK